MTMDDAFDARLKAAFAQAAEPLDKPVEVDAFTAKAMQRLANPDRKRALILGGAGSTGSAVAGTQLETLFGNIEIPADGLMSNVGFLMSPEALAAAAMAIAIATVALVLPRRIA